MLSKDLETFDAAYTQSKSLYSNALRPALLVFGPDLAVAVTTEGRHVVRTDIASQGLSVPCVFKLRLQIPPTASAASLEQFGAQASLTDSVEAISKVVSVGSVFNSPLDGSRQGVSQVELCIPQVIIVHAHSYTVCAQCLYVHCSVCMTRCMPTEATWSRAISSSP